MIKILLFAPLVPIALLLAAIVVCIFIVGCIVTVLAWAAFEVYYMLLPKQRPRVISINDFTEKYRPMSVKDDYDFITL